MEVFHDTAAFSAFVQVILIDLALAGDNAVVIGMAAAGLPVKVRHKAIFFGIIAATVLRIALALVTTQLLHVVGLLFAGGLLLAWVAWKMWQELRQGGHHESTLATETLVGRDLNADGCVGAPPARQKTLGDAFTQILVADISMSLDNVLAVAGAAREHPTVLIFGLILSVAMMGLAASVVARLLNRFRWLAYVGLAIIVYVALGMIQHGAADLFHVAAEPLARMAHVGS
ncbi:MAG: TerC family protein [Hyphomicrobiaceae bacterium]|nr:TerC family protein [Hyphomicrobiaceae bacterium]